MKFILSKDNKNLVLPVNPSEFTIKTGNSHKNFSNSEGDVVLFGNRKLDKITIKSFFKWLDGEAMEKVALIKEWINQGPIQVMIEDVLNKSFLIESFDYGMHAGVKDIYFNMSLIEYRNVTARNINESFIKPQSIEDEKITEYVVKKGDTLMLIAKKMTGTTNYQLLAEKNNIQNPNLIYPGQVIKI